MDNFFREVFLFVIKVVVSSAIAVAYALFKIALYGDTNRISDGKSIIVIVVSAMIGCWIVNKLFRVKK